MLTAPVGTVGILHFPDAPFRPERQAGAPATDAAVEVRALQGGDYTILIYRHGKLESSARVSLGLNQLHRLTVPQMGPAEAVWIKVLNPKPASSPAVTSNTGGKKS
jgi:hypothetical protein